MKKIYLVISSWSLNDIDHYDNNHDCYEVNIATESYAKALRTLSNIATDTKKQFDIENCIEYTDHLDYFFIKCSKDNWFKCILIEQEIN